MSVQYVPERRFRPVPRELPWWAQWVIGGCIVAALMVTPFVFNSVRRALRERDVAGVAPSTTIATVIDKRAWTEGNGKRPPHFYYELTLKWDKHEVKAQVGEMLFKRVRKGHQVSVTYRVGRRTGTVYVDRVEPVYRIVS